MHCDMALVLAGVGARFPCLNEKIILYEVLKYLHSKKKHKSNLESLPN